MVDIGGESPGEVADEESPAIASCRTRIDTVNGRGGIVDKGFDLLPLLLETLFFGLGRFGSLANRFECTFSPFRNAVTLLAWLLQAFSLRPVLKRAGPVIIALAQRLLAAIMAEK
ncbi:hypothetical protein NXX09_24200 [Bacteroides uniformis]|nr:hypothetical protein [Bacteroides uniformis]